MSRLRALNQLIDSVRSEEEANKLVKTWLPEQSDGIDKGTFGCAPGTRNCSLVAEFVITYLNMGIVDYSLLLAGPAKTIKSPFKDIPFGQAGEKVTFHAAIGGHEMAIVREGDAYGLYQAWEGKFHLFPWLNEGRRSHNVFGDGAAAIEAIRRMLVETVGAKDVDLRKGMALWS